MPRPRGAHHRRGALLEALAGFGAPPPRVILTGGDPLKRPDLRTILSAPGPPPCVVLVPLRSGLGTNPACLAPPDPMPLRFGEPSFADHVSCPRSANLNVKCSRKPFVARVFAGIRRPRFPRAGLPGA